MKRRDVIKGLTLSVSALSVPVLALPGPVLPPMPRPKRLVYLVKLWAHRGHYEIREQWGQVSYMRAPLDDAQGFDLVRVGFADPKKGDFFVVYDEKGDLVGNIGGNPVMRAVSDPLKLGSWAVAAEIPKERFDIPKHVRDIER